MGPWGHQVNAGRQLGELDFGHDSVIDLEASMVASWTSIVRGRPPARPDAPVRIFLMGANEWLDLPAWPPPDTTEQACTWTATAAPTPASATAA